MRSDNSSITDDSVDPQVRQSDLDQMPKGYYRNWRFIGSLAATSFLAQGLYLGYVLPANSFTIINAEIGPDANYVLIPTLKTLTGAIGLTLVGRLGDIFGRRWFMIGGSIFAVIGSIICATAQNIPTVLGGTVFIGFAGAVQTSFSYVLMELVANKHRPYITAFLFFTTVPFATFGGLLARTFASHTAAGWRWNYYLNLIVNSIAAILFFICYHPPSHKELDRTKSLGKKLKEIDYIGVLLFSGGLTSFILGLSWGGGLHPWNSVSVILPIVLGFVILVAFGIYEAYMPLTNPLIPIVLFKNASFLALVGVCSVATMFFYSLTVIWPQMVNALYSTDSTMIGLMSGTVGGSVALGQVIGGFTVRLGATYWQMRVAALFMCAFIGAMAACNEHTRTMGIIFTIIGGLAVGVVEVIGIIAVPFTVSPSDLGLASGVLGTARAALGSVALAVFSSVLTTRKTAEIPPRLTILAASQNLSATSRTALIKAGMSGAIATLSKIPGITSANLRLFVQAVRDGNTKAYHMVFYVSLVFGGMAVICAFFCKGFDQHFTNTVDKRLGGYPKKEEVVEKEVV
ncbi:siderophore iron transporter [Halenospora varia]|nr:siderophore iron transporter [Halenospora varia]